MNSQTRRFLTTVTTAAVLTLVGLGTSVAQEAEDDDDDADDREHVDQFFPRQSFLLGGYGGTGYHMTFAEDRNPNDFGVIFAPIMLYQISDRFLFEGEFEFEIEEGVTSTNLEYAQVDVGVTNNLMFMGGKFLLPFATFSERMHPVWINPFVSVPAVYGSHGGTGPTDPLLPILSDIGVQLRGAFEVGRFSSVTAEFYITQGPVGEKEGADHDEVAAVSKALALTGGDLGVDVPAFGGNTLDNNDDKMVGGRIGYVLAPYFEVNVSGMSGAYDDNGDLHFSAAALHLEGRRRHLTVHSEFIRTWQDLIIDEGEDDHNAGLLKSQAASSEGSVKALQRTGYWVSLAHRTGNWQPVVRWTQIFDGNLEDQTLIEGGQQVTVGLSYWFEPSVALKAEYLFNFEDENISNNRVAFQLAFGF